MAGSVERAACKLQLCLKAKDVTSMFYIFVFLIYVGS